MRPFSTRSTVPTCTPSAPMTSICSLILLASMTAPFVQGRNARAELWFERGHSSRRDLDIERRDHLDPVDLDPFVATGSALLHRNRPAGGIAQPQPQQVPS